MENAFLAAIYRGKTNHSLSKIEFPLERHRSNGAETLKLLDEFILLYAEKELW